MNVHAWCPPARRKARRELLGKRYEQSGSRLRSNNRTMYGEYHKDGRARGATVEQNISHDSHDQRHVEEGF